MAAGKYGGYRDEYRGRETDFEVWKKENGFYEWDRNGGLEYKKGQLRDWGRDCLDVKGNAKEKERDVMNGRYHSTSIGTNIASGGGGPRKCEYAIGAIDREPGELYNDEFDEAVDSGTQFNRETDFKILDSSNHISPNQSKKRKLSPIIWDRDDKEASVIKSRSTLDSATIVQLPELVKSYQESPYPEPRTSATINGEINLESSPSNVNLTCGTAEVHGETLSLQPEGDQWLNSMEIGEVDEDDYAPTQTIISSRWDADADLPADEGGISDCGIMPKTRSKSSLELGGAREHSKSISPVVGQVKREGSKATRDWSSGSDERFRSSSRDNYTDNNDNNVCMDIDHNLDGARVSESETESGDYPGSPTASKPAQPPQRSFNMLCGCRSVNEFERLNKINEGTYGVVYRARDKKTGEIVALKKVKMEKEREGFPLTSLREINILLSFDHASVVDVKEVVVGNNLDSIFMAMEYMEHDLKALMESMKQPFSQSEVKCLMLQLFEGVKHLHDNWVLHRDLKTSNLLLNNCGELKICDFGLARQYGSPLKPYTHLVVTLWYRAPELLLGAKLYSTAIDMWSLGCIMAELLSKEPLFNGKTEVEQLDKIFRILGTPNDTIWPGFSKLPGVKVNFVKHKYNLLRKKFPATSFTGSPVLSDTGFDLLNRLLTYDPEKRITAAEALNHEWFHEVPLPKSKEFMPTFPAHHVQNRHMRKVVKSPDPLEDQRRKELQGELGTGGLFGQ